MGLLNAPFKIRSGTTIDRGIVLLGDSITARNHPTVEGAIGGLSLANDGFFNWFNFFMGDAFDVVNYAGVSGDTSTQIAARYDTDVAPYAADWLCLLLGSNDFGSDIATYKANVIEILGKAKSQQRKVLFFTHPAGNVTDTIDALFYNEMLMFIKYTVALAYTNVYVIDTDMVMNDNSGAYPVIIAAKTADGLHPNAAGAIDMGRHGASVLASIVAGRPQVIAADQLDGILSPNPMLSGSVANATGDCTGVVPIGWSGHSSAGGTSAIVCTVEEREAGGNWCKFEYTLDGTNALTFYFRDAVSPTTGFDVGDKIRATMAFEVSPTATQFKQILCEVQMPSGVAFSRTIEQTTTFDDQPISGIFHSPELTIPDVGGGLPPASIRLVCWGFTYAAVETDWIKFGPAQIYKVPT